uniref:Gfo/Idh/MocA-like oxidoreductase N-terminal domain-containing protein n=1 Tax=candidate division WWE3 bacterium TaxID=2053526 RepID=A0A831Z0F7_UNCKA
MLVKVGKIKLAIIGVGPHAKRVYVPALNKLREEYSVELSLTVDLKGKEEDLNDYFKSQEIKPKTMLFVAPFEGKIPSKLRRELNGQVVRSEIDGVIIATEPLVHRAYAEWALDQGLNILMDKPVTTRKNVSSSIVQAKGIEEDYYSLLGKYKKLQKRKKTIFSINVQRRFSPGTKIVLQLIEEIARKTGCPVTSIQSTHCDGQWRLPSEIVTQDNHPYNTGYGKVSHSGYHFFDNLYQLYKVSKLTSKVADQVQVFSSFVTPRGFIKQITEKDYPKYFGREYAKVRKFSDKSLQDIYKNFGEVDTSANVRFLIEGENVCNATINLLHNGFSRRTWVRPGKDLYKGNGRVKHEYHNIEQGPFQNIQIHSYQSSDKHDLNDAKDFELGGNNHFDIYVFRNIGIVGGKKPLEVIRARDIARKERLSSKKLVSEQIKFEVVREFLEFIKVKEKPKKLTSNIDDHEITVKLMSSVYQSWAQQKAGLNPIVTKEVSF